MRLLQDEDETVRQQANTSLNFLNHLADVNCKTNMQSNRTLESLFAVVANRKNKCYLKWLSSVIIHQHKDTSEERLVHLITAMKYIFQIIGVRFLFI